MIMQTQMLNTVSSSNSALAVNHVKHVKVPEGHYHMNPNEFRTYRKDCVDYKKLAQYTDEQVVFHIAPHVLYIHCVAHCNELVIKDASYESWSMYESPLLDEVHTLCEALKKSPSF